MQWDENETVQLRYRLSRFDQNFVAEWRTTKIPVAYNRIVGQLNLEATHSGYNFGHEACRRGSYAIRTLDAFGDELEAYKGRSPENFRSRVLTPILQRHLQGVSDCYAPSVRHAIAPSTNQPTLEQVTKFYLSWDPLDPAWIPSYRRSAVYMTEVRWHLAVVMGVECEEISGTYHRFLADQDHIMAALETNPHDDMQGAGDEVATVEEAIPEFTEAEVEILVNEGIDDFFAEEMDRVVCSSHLSRVSPLILQYISLSFTTKP